MKKIVLLLLFISFSTFSAEIGSSDDILGGGGSKNFQGQTLKLKNQKSSLNVESIKLQKDNLIF